MRFIIALLTLTAVARADQSWPTFGNPYAFTEQGGEAIYRSVCAGCHMADGRGASGAGCYPSLAEDLRLDSASYPIRVVLQGQKAMPRFRDLLTNEQIADVVAYIRAHFGNAYADSLSAADVAAER